MSRFSSAVASWAESQAATLAAVAPCSHDCSWAAVVGSKLLPLELTRLRLSRLVRSLAVILAEFPALSQKVMALSPEALVRLDALAARLQTGVVDVFLQEIFVVIEHGQ